MFHIPKRPMQLFTGNVHVHTLTKSPDFTFKSLSFILCNKHAEIMNGINLVCRS